MPVFFSYNGGYKRWRDVICYTEGMNWDTSGCCVVTMRKLWEVDCQMGSQREALTVLGGSTGWILLKTAALFVTLSEENATTLKQV